MDILMNLDIVESIEIAKNENYKKIKTKPSTFSNAKSYWINAVKNLFDSQKQESTSNKDTKEEIKKENDEKEKSKLIDQIDIEIFDENKKVSFEEKRALKLKPNMFKKITGSEKEKSAENIQNENEEIKMITSEEVQEVVNKTEEEKNEITNIKNKENNTDLINQEENKEINQNDEYLVKGIDVDIENKIMSIINQIGINNNIVAEGEIQNNIEDDKTEGNLKSEDEENNFDKIENKTTTQNEENNFDNLLKELKEQEEEKNSLFKDISQIQEEEKETEEKYLYVKEKMVEAENIVISKLQEIKKENKQYQIEIEEHKKSVDELKGMIEKEQAKIDEINKILKIII